MSDKHDMPIVPKTLQHYHMIGELHIQIPHIYIYTFHGALDHIYMEYQFQVQIPKK